MLLGFIIDGITLLLIPSFIFKIKNYLKVLKLTKNLYIYPRLINLIKSSINLIK